MSHIKYNWFVCVYLSYVLWKLPRGAPVHHVVVAVGVVKRVKIDRLAVCGCCEGETTRTTRALRYRPQVEAGFAVKVVSP